MLALFYKSKYQFPSLATALGPSHRIPKSVATSVTAEITQKQHHDWVEVFLVHEHND